MCVSIYLSLHRHLLLSFLIAVSTATAVAYTLPRTRLLARVGKHRVPNNMTFHLCIAFEQSNVRYYMTVVVVYIWLQVVTLLFVYNAQLKHYPMAERSVPLMAVISANAINIPFMRKE